MVVPNVLGNEILENNFKITGNEEAYPKLSTKDVGKNPTKPPNHANAIKGSGFCDKVLGFVGGVFVMNGIHVLMRNMMGNPWYCLGMAKGLYEQATTSLTGKVLYGYEKSERLLEYFQRKTEEYNQIDSASVQTKPVFQGVLTPMSKNEIQAQINDGKAFAEKHPYLALFILKRFDAMLAMGIDIFSGVKPFDTDSPIPNDSMNSVPLYQSTDQNESMGSSYTVFNGFDNFSIYENK